MYRSFFIFIALLGTININAQNNDSFDEFRKNALAGMDKFRDKTLDDFKEFRKKINSDYADFLREGIWHEEKAQPTLPPIVEPAPIPPVVMPEEDKDKTIENKPVVIEEVIPTPQPQPQPQPVAPIEEIPPSPIIPAVTFSFNYYGTSMGVRLTEQQKFTLKNIKNKAIGDAWEKLSQDEYTNLIYDCLQLRKERTLCDWAYLQFLNDLSTSFLGKNTNEATLLTAYIYCQSGYRIRLAKDKKRLYLMVGTHHQVYNCSNYTINGLNYFVYNADPSSVEVCDNVFKGEKALDLYVPNVPLLKEDLSESRTLKAERYPDLSITSRVNKNLLSFFNEYPTSKIGDNFLTRWAMYANTPMEKEVKESLYPALKQNISGITEKDAVERLLNWVQTAFVYEYDDKVWGHDRAFFAEETLYYPYCDCEDRSILFTRLVRDLLGMKCILVYYPGHLASAVCFNEQVAGDYISLDGNRFTICDATFINAPVGRTMPDMDNKEAKVIVLE